MVYEHAIRRYRHWYEKLLRLHSKQHYERFGEGMEQTFGDILRERAEEERGLLGCATWMFVETSAGIIRENVTCMIMQNVMKSMMRAVIGTGLILLVPLVLQLTIGTGVDGQGFNWELGDFVVIGMLLFVGGFAIDVARRKLTHSTYQIPVMVAIVLVFLLIWADLAVGIFNIPGISGS